MFISMFFIAHHVSLRFQSTELNVEPLKDQDACNAKK